MLVRGDRITVGVFDDEADYSENVARTFERFRQGAVENYISSLSGHGLLRRSWACSTSWQRSSPNSPRKLDVFCRAHLDYMDDAVRLLDRELEFYLAYLKYIDSLRAAGLAFSTPKLSSTDKRERA